MKPVIVLGCVSSAWPPCSSSRARAPRRPRRRRRPARSPSSRRPPRCRTSSGTSAERRVHVVGILRPNVDPHDFEPTPSDGGRAGRREARRRVGRRARRLGRPADRRAPARRRRSSTPRPASRLRPGDPHWWGDPTLVERAATALGRRLGAGRSRPSRRLRRNAARYVSQVEAMDAANRRLVATVPAAERKLVTNHDAFAYLAAHYDIRVVGSVIPRAVDGGPAERAGRRRPDRPDPGGARPGDLHRVVARPDPRAADRVGGRRRASTPTCTATRSARRARRARPTWAWSAGTSARWWPASSAGQRSRRSVRDRVANGCRSGRRGVDSRAGVTNTGSGPDPGGSASRSARASRGSAPPRSARPKFRSIARVRL